MSKNEINNELKINRKIIKEFNEILNNNNNENNKENKLLDYLKNNNLNPLNILEGDNSNLGQIYCEELDDLKLKIILSVFKSFLIENDFITFLLHENINEMNLFEIASEKSEIKIFKILEIYLKNNPKILMNLIKTNKENIFHIAVRNKKYLSLLFYYNFYNNSFCLNITNKNKSTPLHLASYLGDSEMVGLLLDLGASIDLFDNEKKTPLFYATMSFNLRTVKKLLINGANKYLKDNQNKIAFNYAIDLNIKETLRKKSLIDIMFKCKIDIGSIKNQKKHVLFIFLFVVVFIIQIYIKIGFSLHKNCLNKKFIKEKIFFYVSLINEIFCIIIIFSFHYLKNKNFCSSQNNINNNNLIEKINNLNNIFLKNESQINLLEEDFKENLESIPLNKEIPLFEYYNKINKICVICRKIKGKTTQHCLACNKCIDYWDHHCFWLNICIHKNNKKYFNIFLFFIIVSLLNNTISGILYLINFIKYHGIYRNIFSDNCKNNFEFIGIVFLLILIFYILSLIFFLLSTIIPFIFNFMKC